MSISVREVADVVFIKMNDMMNDHVTRLLTTVQKTDTVFSKTEVTKLLRKEFQVFSKEVQESFSDPQEVEFAQMYLSSFQLQMIGGSIKKQVIQALGTGAYEIRINFL